MYVDFFPLPSRKICTWLFETTLCISYVIMNRTKSIYINNQLMTRKRKLLLHPHIGMLYAVGY